MSLSDGGRVTLSATLAARARRSQTRGLLSFYHTHCHFRDREATHVIYRYCCLLGLIDIITGTKVQILAVLALLSDSHY